MKNFLMCLLGTVAVFSTVFANDTIYEQRRLAYIDSAIQNASPNLILQAYKGLPLDQTELNDKLSTIPTKSTVDFDIIQLIRILYLTNGQYDTVILNALEPIPFWLTYGDTLHTYWSENHMIMWMGSNWLLHEKYGWPIDSDLENRLNHYLDLKIDYGYYEYFSTTYFPYTLGGLLNLADFAADTTIKNKAALAANRLMKDVLLLVNDEGVFYPAAGRNYHGRYAGYYDQNLNGATYLLTGRGPLPSSASLSGSFLSTSTIQVDSVVASWVPELDFVYSFGHSLDSGFVLNSTQSPLDKVIFQWSSGAYFHPAVASESAYLIADSNLWDHVDFRSFGPISSLDPANATAIAELLKAISYSSVNCGVDISIFKKNSVVLTSIQDFWKGKAGYQQYPCVATVGTTAVFTGSGNIKQNWNNRNSNNANQHLPYISQSHNVALLMYWPEPNNIYLQSDDVGLYWKSNDFDEVRNDSLWLLGRQGESYVAVRRYCPDSVNTVPACPTGAGQSWVIVVGDSSMYTDFNTFENIISQAKLTEQWYYDSTQQQRVYYAKIEVDTIDIEYAWRRDEPISGIKDIAPEAFKVYPNPAQNLLNIDLNAFTNSDIQVSITNLMGQRVYGSGTTIESSLQVETANWPEGMYLVQVQSGKHSYCRKVLIAR